jgi:hypothetical protein
MEPGATITWKLTDGTFVEVDATGIQTIALAVAAHVQACFALESSLGAQLSAAPTIDEIHAVDITVLPP